MNLLFTNAGRRTYLIEYAFDLKSEGYDLNIFVSDTSYDTAAMHVHPEVHNIITPRVSGNEEEYFVELLTACKKHNIDVIIPLMDFELPVLSSKKAEFEKAGIMVWVSDKETITNCLNKKTNYNFCISNEILIPDTYFNLDNIEPPVVKKRILGSGSVGLEIVQEGAVSNFEPGVDLVQKLVEGKEYGMDILNSYEGKYVHYCIREKIAMRSGETDKAKTLESQELTNLAQHISSVFKHVGNMDIDFIKTESGEIYFIDFNPRFGGGYPFTHLSGANYLKFIVESSLRIENKYRPTFKKSITGYKGLKVFHNEN